MLPMTNVNPPGQPIGPPLEGWTPWPRPSDAPMNGRACQVVRLDPEVHGEQLHEAFGRDADAANWTYLSVGPFENRAAFDSWLTAAAAGTDPYFQVVLERATGRAVGVAALMRIDPDNGIVEIGHIHFSPLLQRTTLATEAMFLFMCRVFDELGYRRYEWKCDALNAPSCRAALRFGFTHEGIFRKALVYKGRSRDIRSRRFKGRVHTAGGSGLERSVRPRPKRFG